MRVLFTVAGTVRSLKFSKAGNHLIAGNDYGSLVIFDVNKATPLEIIQTCQNKAVWSIDISFDDSLISVGTEDATIELYNFQKIIIHYAKV